MIERLNEILGKFPLRYGVLVFIALRALLVSVRSVGAEDEMGACFGEFLGVKESINAPACQLKKKDLFPDFRNAP